MKNDNDRSEDEVMEAVSVDFCPACGEPMEDHVMVLVVPVIVFDVELGYFVRHWRHSSDTYSSDPSRN